MSVHHEISNKVKAIRHIIVEYKRLDELREKEIEAALSKAMRQEPFSVDLINRATKDLNEFAATHHLPSRKLVTREMVLGLDRQS